MESYASAPIVVQFAMRGEAAPLLKRGVFQGFEPEFTSPYGFEFHRGTTALGDEVLVAVAGLDAQHQVDAIGTLRAVLLA